MRATLLLLVASAAGSSAAIRANLPCTTRPSCSNHGDCINQRCVCDSDSGFYGPNCSTAAPAKGICTDTRCGGAARLCCEGSTALQKRSMCVGSVTCDSCCGWVQKPATPVDAGALPSPRVTYRHNYNQDGHSRWAECSFSHFASQDFIPGVKPFFIDTTTNTSLPPHSGNRTQIKAQKLLWLDPDYDADWHQEPAVQLIAIISGHGEWTNEEGGAGAVQRFGPGDFYLGDDRGTAKGHRSRAVGGGGTDGEPLVILATQFTIPGDASGGHANRPCWL